MKLTKICIRNYRGLETLDVDIPKAGMIAKGGNARGKSSFLKAIKGVLESRDIAADAIRLGADRAEILVDLDNVSVKRVITEKSSTVTVERDGMKASKPTAYLKDLLGTSALDPLELFLAKPKDRRGLILAALPCKVTIEQLKKYAPDIDEKFDVTGHGLDVIARACKFYYDERTQANKEAEEARRTADRISEEATAIAKKLPPGPAVSREDAQFVQSEAERSLISIEERAQAAAAAAARTEGQRSRITSLRREADETEKDADAIKIDEPGNIDLEIQEGEKVIAALEKKLEAARGSMEVLKGRRLKADEDIRKKRAMHDRANDLRSQADTLASALAAAAVEAPSPEAIDAAKKAVEDARAKGDRANLQAKALAAVEAADVAKKTASAVEAEAEELDVIVKRLQKEAPSELLAATDGIKGLTLDGEEVLLDGVRLDALSGAEQLKFAVEVARRANAKTRILVVDGLERLDGDQLEEFVRHATRDDWQLLGSLVTRGELVLAAIENDDTAVAAE